MTEKYLSSERVNAAKSRTMSGVRLTSRGLSIIAGDLDFISSCATKASQGPEAMDWHEIQHREINETAIIDFFFLYWDIADDVLLRNAASRNPSSLFSTGVVVARC